MGTSSETVTISRDTYEVLLANYRDHVALKRALFITAPLLDQEQDDRLPKVGLRPGWSPFEESR